MNREEARNHLAEWLDKKMWRCFGTIDREAISIAVEALSEGNVAREIATIIENEQDMRVILHNADRPTRGRKDATKEDYAYCDDCEAVEMCMWYPYDGCIFKIQSRPKGEWIGEGDGYADGGIVYDTWYCSECDHREEGEEVALPNYCPNCGADMRSEKEYLDKTFPEHEGGEWFDITDMMTREGKE